MKREWLKERAKIQPFKKKKGGKRERTYTENLVKIRRRINLRTGTWNREPQKQEKGFFSPTKRNQPKSGG